MEEKFQLVVIKDNYGGHTDVYVDFENQILQQTRWKKIKAANKYLQRLYNIFILPKLKYRQFNFDYPSDNQNKCLFASISGTEYSKIFLQYSFKAKLKAIYMFDPWPTVNKINENAIRSYKINIAFISAKQTIDHFNSLGINNFRAYWIPEAINSNNFRHCNLNDKSIDLLQYGRHWQWLHENLELFCKEKKIIYEYSDKTDL